MARSLEHALQHAVAPPGTSEQALVFTNAAEDIRRLLHQFAAGFLKEPDANILVALQQIIETEFPAPTIDSIADALDDDISILEEEVFEDSVAVETVAPEEDLSTAPTAVDMPIAAPLAIVAAPLNIAQAQDDDIDAVDQLDEDLFPIFEEEALELMPQLGAALRQWVARPDFLGARTEILRVLHTLKREVRVWPVRCGWEMSHHMESSIEQIGTEHVQSVQLEPC
jgi:chemosensory pili system protein ChpA (sensor histidine kinase/response regulator)